MANRYPEDTLDEYYDDNGTMPENVDQVRKAVVGHKIVSAEIKTGRNRKWSWQDSAFVITLDNGVEVELYNTDDCCAYTELEAFLLNPELVDHVITGVETEGGFTTWHIYADAGDVLKLTVGWSPGNPFYYGYGFDIRVTEVDGE